MVEPLRDVAGGAAFMIQSVLLENTRERWSSSKRKRCFLGRERGRAEWVAKLIGTIVARASAA